MEFRRYDKHVGHVGNERHGLEVLDRIVGQLLEKIGIDGVRGNGADAKRHAVRLLLGKIRHAAVAAGTGPVVDDDVAELVMDGFSNSTCRNVQRASGRIRNNNANAVGTSSRLREGRQRD